VGARQPVRTRTHDPDDHRSRTAAPPFPTPQELPVPVLFALLFIVLAAGCLAG